MSNLGNGNFNVNFFGMLSPLLTHATFKYTVDGLAWEKIIYSLWRTDG